MHIPRLTFSGAAAIMIGGEDLEVLSGRRPGNAGVLSAGDFRERMTGRGDGAVIGSALPEGSVKRTGGHMAHLTSWYWDRGSYRETNEDSFSLQSVALKARHIGKRSEGRRRGEVSLLLVCDGIGGLEEGETASGFAAERLTEWFYTEGIALTAGRFWRRRAMEALGRAFLEIQSEMERRELEDALCCGTTCTLALVKNASFVLLHVGDSRAYRVGRRVKLLTADHVEGGALRRCLGAVGFQPPDARAGRLAKGEMLLLCTDGFYRLTPDNFFRGCFYGEGKEADTLYRRMQGAAGFVRTQGEKDNITALLLVNGGRRRHVG